MTRRQICRIGPFAAEVLAMGGGGTVTAARRGAAFVQIGGGPVLAVLPHGTPIHPWALSAPIDLSVLREGARVRMGESVLAIGSTLIPLSDAQVIELSLMTAPARLPVCAMRLVLDYPVPASNHGPFGPAFERPLADYQGSGDVQSLIPLLGLGKGLTPSGDDVLVGVLAGLDLLRDAPGPAATDRCELLSRLLPELEEGTSVFSASMLRAAAEGHYAEPILDLLNEVAHRGIAPAPIEMACAAIIEIGHDSGASILEGIRASFRRALSPDPDRPSVHPVPAR